MTYSIRLSEGDDLLKLKQNMDAMAWLIRNSKSVTDNKFLDMLDAFKLLTKNNSQFIHKVHGSDAAQVCLKYLDPFDMTTTVRALKVLQALLENVECATQTAEHKGMIILGKILQATNLTEPNI